MLKEVEDHVDELRVEERENVVGRGYNFAKRCSQ